MCDAIKLREAVRHFHEHDECTSYGPLTFDEFVKRIVATSQDRFDRRNKLCDRLEIHLEYCMDKIYKLDCAEEYFCYNEENLIELNKRVVEYVGAGISESERLTGSRIVEIKREIDKHFKDGEVYLDSKLDVLPKAACNWVRELCFLIETLKEYIDCIVYGVEDYYVNIWRSMR